MVFPVGEETYPQLHNAAYQLSISAADSNGRGAAQDLFRTIYISKNLPGSGEDIFRYSITGRTHPYGPPDKFTQKFDAIKASLKELGVDLDSDPLKAEATTIRGVLDKAQKSIDAITMERKTEIVEEEAKKVTLGQSPVDLNAGKKPTGTPQTEKPRR